MPSLKEKLLKDYEVASPTAPSTGVNEVYLESTMLPSGKIVEKTPLKEKLLKDFEAASLSQKSNQSSKKTKEDITKRFTPEQFRALTPEQKASALGIAPDKPLEQPLVVPHEAALIGGAMTGRLAIKGGATLLEAALQALSSAEIAAITDPITGTITEEVTKKAGEIDPRLRTPVSLFTSLVTGAIADKSARSLFKALGRKSIKIPKARFTAPEPVKPSVKPVKPVEIDPDIGKTIVETPILKTFDVDTTMANVFTDLRKRGLAPTRENIKTAIDAIRSDLKNGKITSGVTKSILDEIDRSFEKNNAVKNIEETVISSKNAEEFDLKTKTEKALGIKKTIEIEKPNGEVEIKPFYPEEPFKNPLAEQKGAITLPSLSAIEKGTAKYKNSFEKMFTKHVGLDINTRETFVALEELPLRMKKQAVAQSIDVFDIKKGTTLDEANLIRQAMESKTEEALPDNLQVIASRIKRVQGDLLEEQRAVGIKVNKWPDDNIKANEKLIENARKTISDNNVLMQSALLEAADKETKLKIKASFRGKEKRLLKKINKIEAINKKLENAGFVSRITRKKLSLKKLGRKQRRKLKVDPKQGRKFITVKEAEDAGFEVANPVEGLADLIYRSKDAVLKQKLIQSINKNEKFSSKIRQDESWSQISSDIFPAAKGRWYHPAIVDAIEEYAVSLPSLGVIGDAIEKFNYVGKHISFYNPVIMLGINDGQQAWQLGGFTGVPRAFLGVSNFKGFLKSLKNDDIRSIWKYMVDNSAVTHVLKESPLYLKLEAAGVFSTALDTQPSIAAITEQMIDVITKTKGERFAKQFKRDLNPLLLAKDTLTFGQKVTWTGDKIWRMAGFLFVDNNPRFKHLSFFEKVDRVNDAFAAYNKIPKLTKRMLNLLAYVPSFKIATMRKLKQIWTRPKEQWPELLRHYAYKVFMTVALPGIIASMYGEREKEARREGHKIIMPYEKWDDIKKKYVKVEKVLSFSGPLLEESKLLNRKAADTLKFNSSFIVQGIITIAQGPRWNAMKDKNGKPIKDSKIIADRLSEFFKTGMPVKKELDLFAREDINNYEKFVSLIGVAFIYDRKARNKGLTETEWANQVTSFLAAMDLWTDWKKRGQEVKEGLFGKTAVEKKKKAKFPSKGQFKPINIKKLLKK